jgi:TonB family protein
MNRVFLLLLFTLIGCSSPHSGEKAAYIENANKGVLAETISKGPKDDAEKSLFEHVDRLFASVPGYRPYTEDIGKRVVRPKILHSEAPVYPTSARRQNITGTVVLVALVDISGNVADVKVIESPDQRLSAAAVSALSKWRFSPGTVEGKPDMFTMVFPIVFSLNR